jgi:hypothetical protein
MAGDVSALRRRPRLTQKAASAASPPWWGWGGKNDKERFFPRGPSGGGNSVGRLLILARGCACAALRYNSKVRPSLAGAFCLHAAVAVATLAARRRLRRTRAALPPPSRSFLVPVCAASSSRPSALDSALSLAEILPLFS